MCVGGMEGSSDPIRFVTRDPSSFREGTGWQKKMKKLKINVQVEGKVNRTEQQQNKTEVKINEPYIWVKKLVCMQVGS